MVPIRFSQHEHRILTGQKPYFKRVLPLFSQPYLTARKSLINARVVDKNAIPLESIFTLKQVLDGDWFPIDIEPFLETRP